MRLREIPEYFRLRKHMHGASDFLRNRKKPLAEPFYDVKLKDGRTIRLRTTTQDRHIFLFVFGRDEYRLDRVPKGSLDTVVEIGAHVGIFTHRVAPLARRILSFEPFPDNYRLLKENVEQLPHATPVRQAIAAKPGPRKLYLGDDPGKNSMAPSSEEARAARSVPVEAVTLEEAFEKHKIERCDLLKVDCEGSEYEILFSVPPGIWSRIHRVAMEYHPVAGHEKDYTARHLVELLERMGHRVRVAPRRKHPQWGMIFSERR